jgi:fucose 4-O-acetylase-like acetyltransferase
MEPNNRTEMSFQFIPWVTLAKVLGLYLMVLGHEGLVDSETTHWIFTFHMPLFFILSGAFTKRDVIRKEQFQKIFQTLIIPFLFLATCWYLIFAAKWIKNDIYESSLFVGYLLGTFLSPGKSMGMLHPSCITLWFFLALAEIKMAALFLRERWDWVVVVTGCVLTSLLLHHFQVTLPLAIDSAILALPFFAIGKWMRKVLLQSDIHVCKLLLYIVLTGGGTYLIYRLNGIVDINHCLYGNNILLFYAGGVIGSVCVFMISQMISIWYKGQGVIHTIVQGATIIIGFSSTLSSSIRSVLPFLGGSNLGGMLIAVLTLVALYPVILISRRYFPLIIGRRKS